MRDITERQCRELEEMLAGAGFVDCGMGVSTGEGVWVHEEHSGYDGNCHYRDVYTVIEITDLGEACGADGQVVVQCKCTGFDVVGERMRDVLVSCGVKAYGMDALVPNHYRVREDVRDSVDWRKLSRCWVVADVVRYGISDPVSDCHVGFDGYRVVVWDSSVITEECKDWREDEKHLQAGEGWDALKQAVLDALCAAGLD